VARDYLSQPETTDTITRLCALLTAA
jgi:hypothetical protein